MGRNGKRRPPRPRIEVVSRASAPEAAAIVAALEQFLADTAPPPAAPAATPSRWQRAALEDGISARQLSARTWGTAAQV